MRNRRMTPGRRESQSNVPVLKLTTVTNICYLVLQRLLRKLAKRISELATLEIKTGEAFFTVPPWSRVARQTLTAWFPDRVCLRAERFRGSPLPPHQCSPGARQEFAAQAQSKVLSDCICTRLTEACTGLDTSDTFEIRGETGKTLTSYKGNVE